MRLTRWIKDHSGTFFTDKIPAGILSLISAPYSRTEIAIESGGGISRFSKGCVLVSCRLCRLGNGGDSGYI